MTAVCRLIAFLFALVVFAHPAVYQVQTSPTSAHATEPGDRP